MRPVRPVKAGVAGSLTAVTARGFVWSFGGSAGQAVLGIVSVVVLARLLTPAEFGSAAAASLVVGFALLFSQVGVGPALVQRKVLEQVDVAAAFTFSVLTAVALAAAILLLAPWVNPLVGLPRENDLLRLLSIAFVLNGVAAVPTGLLQRRLMFRQTALVDVTSTAVGTIGVTAVLAVLGYGAAALVWGSIASSAITTTSYLALARPPAPLMTPRRTWRHVRPLLRFGSLYSLSQVGNWTAQNADNLVTANVLGPAALGVYNRAYRLLSQPANLIGGAADRVLFPAMSKVRDDPVRLRRAYVRATSLVAMVAVPASVLLVVLAPQLVEVLLGTRWDGVVVPLQILAVVLLPRASYKISGSLTRATGAVGGGAWRQWLYAAEVTTFCAIGARWGIAGVAAGASVAIVVHFLTMLHFSSRISRGLMGAVLGMYVRKHAPLGAVVLAATWGTAEVLRGAPAVVTLLVAGVTGSAVAVGYLLLVRRFFAEELAVVGTLMTRRRGKKKSSDHSE